MTLKNLAQRLLPGPFYRLAGRIKGASSNTAASLIAKTAARLHPSSRIRIQQQIEVIGKLDHAVEVLMGARSHAELNMRLKACSKEPDTVAWLEEFGPNTVFYDIGANSGSYSLLAAKLHFPHIRVIAFEPSFSTYASLCRNIALNHLGDNIQAYPIALAQTKGVSVFNYTNLSPGSALHTLGEARDLQGKKFVPVSTQPVISYSLDTFIGEFDLPLPTHIKLDVDGIEEAVLQGASKILQSPSVRSILLEQEGSRSELERIVDFLGGFGFHLRSHSPTRHNPNSKFIEVHNYIFERSK